MKRYIHFKDISHKPDIADCKQCTPDIFKTAVMCQEHKDLRFDNLTGVTLDNHLGELSKLSNPREFVPHINVDDVLRWEFKSHVNNSISRIQRGFAA